MAKKLFKLLIIGYQKIISPIVPGKCRYYPTCSNYALTQFEKRSFIPALISTIFRILRCNQLFEGGFDYPTINFKFYTKRLEPHNIDKKKILYWLIPYKDGKVKVIKDFKST